MKIKPGGVRAGIDVPQSFTSHLGAGLIATNGVQYSAAVTFGTTQATIISELIDPGFTMQLSRPMEVGITQRFTEVDTDTAGSLIFAYDAREEYDDAVGTAGNPIKRTGSWVQLSATYAKATGSNTALSDTFSGFVPLGSITRAPVRIRLQAVGLQPTMKGEVKNSSYIRLHGNVIPGA